MAQCKPETYANPVGHVLNDTGSDAACVMANYSDVMWLPDFLHEFKKSLFMYEEPHTIVLIAVYVIVFLLAAFGNIMVILVVLINKSMRNVTNYFLLNLAIADLLVTVVCIPLTVGEAVYKMWVYGEFLCKITSYLQGVSVGASVLTIMALSLYRYLAVRRPVATRRLATSGLVRMVSIVVWMIAAGVMVPLAVVRKLMYHPEPTIGFTVIMCHEKWPSKFARSIYDVVLFIFIYVIPGGVVICSYTMTGCRLFFTDRHLQREDSDWKRTGNIQSTRRRVARMLLVLAILFAVCWSPYHIVNLYIDFNRQGDHQSPFTLLVLRFCLLLGHSHSAQNPILYCVMNRGFKTGIMRLMKCRKLPTESRQASYLLANEKHASVRRAQNVIARQQVPQFANAPPNSSEALHWSNRTSVASDSDDECHEGLPLKSLNAHAHSNGDTTGECLMPI